MTNPDQKLESSPEMVQNSKGELVPANTVYSPEDIERMQEGSRKSGQFVDRYLPKQSS